MNASRTNCFSIELARIRISNALTSAQHCFKLRSAGGQAVLLEHAERRQADPDRRGCALAGAAGPADVRGDEHHRAAAPQLELDEEVPIVLEPRPDDAAVAADREPELTRRLGRVEVECDFHDRSFHGLQSISLTERSVSSPSNPPWLRWPAPTI